MPCAILPPFPAPPPLPAGMSLSVFPGLTLPSIGLCCKIQVPPWGLFPGSGYFPTLPAITLSIAFPQAVIAAYAKFVQALQYYYDAIAIPCPTD